jgi:hypothetical protein
MPHKTQIVHHIEGYRIRLRTPSKRHDDAFFQNVKERLNRIEGMQASVQPLTGSVVIHYSGSLAAFFEKAAETGLSELLEIETGVPEPVAEGLQTLVPSDWKGVLFVALLIFGGLQVLRA